MHTSTNYYIVNMALGDTIATFVGSAKAMMQIYYGLEWFSGIMGIIACKTQYVLLISGIICSIFSLVVITFERFLAVCYPLKNIMPTFWTKYIIPVIWMVSLGLPFLINISFHLEIRYFPDGTESIWCVPVDITYSGITLVLIGFVLPQVFISILYIKIAYKLCKRRIPGENVGQNAAQRTAKKVTYMVGFISS